MIEVAIDGKKFSVEPGITIIQACELAGIEVPRFCYHERLAIAGNCRMCLVEVEGVRKPVASCAQAVAPNMKISTKSAMVEKARNGVMEFLLINHPLDCPICDQGGECDLQEQALHYGRAETSFEECKRSVEHKNFGPLIKTFMNRCIHCTRCVRFIENVAGTHELGAIHRGEHMEIVAEHDGPLKSELSGNIIDLCPVGALTSGPFAYKARAWELRDTDSIDVFDALGSNIILQSKGREVMRVLPRVNEEINEEWITDKVRFCYDGLKYRRLDRFYVKKHGELQEATKVEALDAIAQKIENVNPQDLMAIAGDKTDLETMVAIKGFMKAVGAFGNQDFREDFVDLSPTEIGLALLNSGMAGIEEADHIFIIGSNPRLEAPLLNARIRKAVVQNGASVSVIGEEFDLTYPHTHVSKNPWVLNQINNKEHDHYQVLKAAKRLCVVVGISVFARSDSAAFKHHIMQLVKNFKVINEDRNGLNVLPLNASTVGGLRLQFTAENYPQQLAAAKVVFLFAADNINPHSIPKDAYIVYVGHHGDRMAELADVIVPAPAFCEKESSYFNAFNQRQVAYKAVSAPTDQVLEEWQFLQGLAAHMQLHYPLQSFADVRKALDEQLGGGSDVVKMLRAVHYKPKSFIHDEFFYPIKNFYKTDTITRASKVMSLLHPSL